MGGFCGEVEFEIGLVRVMLLMTYPVDTIISISSIRHRRIRLRYPVLITDVRMGVIHRYICDSTMSHSSSRMIGVLLRPHHMRVATTTTTIRRRLFSRRRHCIIMSSVGVSPLNQSRIDDVMVGLPKVLPFRRGQPLTTVDGKI